MAEIKTISIPGNPYGVETPLRYPGGKSSLSGLLSALIDNCAPVSQTYVEPYAGGAGAGLNLLFNGCIEDIVINDLDPAIFCFWKSVTENNARFLERLSEIDISIEEWYKQRDIYRKHDLRKKFDLGFATFFLNRCNRSGIIKGGVIGGYKQDGLYKLDARFNRGKLISKIRKIGQYADRITVLKLDGKCVFEKYGSDARSLIYLDPPYVQQGMSLYMNAFENKDHISLANMVTKSSYRASNWIVTYDCSELISSKKCYGDLNIYKYALRYSAQQKRNECEYLICSDSLKSCIDSFVV